MAFCTCTTKVLRKWCSLSSTKRKAPRDAGPLFFQGARLGLLVLPALAALLTTLAALLSALSGLLHLLAGLLVLPTLLLSALAALLVLLAALVLVLISHCVRSSMFPPDSKNQRIGPPDVPL